MPKKQLTPEEQEAQKLRAEEERKQLEAQQAKEAKRFDEINVELRARYEDAKQAWSSQAPVFSSRDVNTNYSSEKTPVRKAAEVASKRFPLLRIRVEFLNGECAILAEPVLRTVTYRKNDYSYQLNQAEQLLEKTVYPKFETFNGFITGFLAGDEMATNEEIRRLRQEVEDLRFQRRSNFGPEGGVYFAPMMAGPGPWGFRG